MLNKISNCRSFADVSKCVELLKILNNNPCTLKDLRTFFSYDTMLVLNLNDTLKLLQVIGYVELVDLHHEEYYTCNSDKVNKHIIIRDVLIMLINEKNVEVISIDDYYYVYLIQEFYALRNFLFFEEIIEKTKLNINIFKVSEEYYSEIRKRIKKMDKTSLKTKLEAQQEMGEDAEKYVLMLEEERLNNMKKPKHIALEDNNAGFDICSFNDISSDGFDKFIEVKCYSEFNNNLFYISRNEIQKSKVLGDKYFLYLIDSKYNVNPIIIQNPYNNIFINEKINYVIENISYKVNDIKLYSI